MISGRGSARCGLMSFVQQQCSMCRQGIKSGELDCLVARSHSLFPSYHGLERQVISYLQEMFFEVKSHVYD